MKMIPSNAIAAVASSALRNYKGNPISSVTRFMNEMNKQREKIKTNKCMLLLQKLYFTKMNEHD